MFKKLNIFFKYKKSTSTTSLRPHIERYHLDLYLQVAKEKGWKISLPGLKSQAQSQAASDASASQVGQSAQFSEEIFHQYLLNFIIVDDQVRSYFFYFTCS